MTDIVDGYFFMFAYKNTAAVLRKQKMGNTSVSTKGAKILYKHFIALVSSLHCFYWLKLQGQIHSTCESFAMRISV